jgi:hypothetical protein
MVGAKPSFSDLACSWGWVVGAALGVVRNVPSVTGFGAMGLPRGDAAGAAAFAGWAGGGAAMGAGTGAGAGAGAAG